MVTRRPFSRSLIPTAAALAACLSTSPALAEKPALSLYGFIRLDIIVDSQPTDRVQEPMYVLSATDPPQSGSFSLHPRASRIGLTVDDWSPVGNLDSEGRLEVDLMGGTRDRPSLRLRHAYFTFAADRFAELLLGQTWDLMSPLFPAANFETMMWNAGNTGDRRPQFRLTLTPFDKYRFGFSIGPGGELSLRDNDGDGRGDGEASMVPMVQWLMEYRQRFRRAGILRLGIWGHAAFERHGDGTEYESWSFGGHLYLPLSRRLTLLGEFFRGQNLGDVRGGIGQGINVVDGREITATGGWAELAYTPSRRHLLAIGTTVDQADIDDLESFDRRRNATYYAAIRYRPHRAVQLGAEYIRWITDYVDLSRGTNNRVDLFASMAF